MTTSQDSTPPLSFTREENAALLASVSASLQLLEEAEESVGLPRGSAWTVLNSLRTVFAENDQAFDRHIANYVLRIEQRDGVSIATVPYVAIAGGEYAPWADAPLTCPTCGAGPLELHSSEATGSGVVLRYITHCDGTWLRGEVNL